MPSPSTDIQEIIAHIDGGSRGNPGPAAYAVVVDAIDGTRLASLSKFLGRTTNNVAEYEGLLAALDYALEHNFRRLKVISDSELLARQINGQYKVRNPNLKVLHERALALIAQFDGFRIEHVRREHNRDADRLANEAMDAAEGKKKPLHTDAAGQTHRRPQIEPAQAAQSEPFRATATYHQGVLKLDKPLSLSDGEEVDLEIRRRE